MDRLTGKITYINEPRGFYFVEVKLPDSTITRYYLHCSKIQACLPATITKGCRVTFIPGPTNSARPADFPTALDAHVYWPAEQAQQAQQAPQAPPSTTVRQ